MAKPKRNDEQGLDKPRVHYGPTGVLRVDPADILRSRVGRQAQSRNSGAHRPSQMTGFSLRRIEKHRSASSEHTPRMYRSKRKP